MRVLLESVCGCYWNCCASSVGICRLVLLGVGALLSGFGVIPVIFSTWLSYSLVFSGVLSVVLGGIGIRNTYCKRSKVSKISLGERDKCRSDSTTIMREAIGVSGKPEPMPLDQIEDDKAEAGAIKQNRKKVSNPEGPSVKHRFIPGM